MTDFGPLIANPKVFIRCCCPVGYIYPFCRSNVIRVSRQLIGAIGIIGGADGPTAIFVATKLAQNY